MVILRNISYGTLQLWMEVFQEYFSLSSRAAAVLQQLRNLVLTLSLDDES